MSPPMEVETLLPQLQDTLAQIKSTIAELSSSAQDDDLDQLEQRRDQLLADLQKSFQKEKEELESKRQSELEEIKKKRQREDEERAAQRRREDEEFQKAKNKEEQNQKQNYDHEVDSIEDETERKIDEVEQMVEKKIEEGKRKLHDLDEKRKELNRRIDDQLTQSLPTSPPRRKRSKKESNEPPKDQLNKPEGKASEDKIEKPEDKLSTDQSKAQEKGLPKDVSEKKDDALPNGELKKRDDKLSKDKPEDKSASQEHRALNEKTKVEENESQKNKSNKQENGLPQDELKKHNHVSKPNGEKDENQKEKPKKPEEEPSKGKTKKHEDGLSGDELKKQPGGLPDQPINHEYEQPKDKSKKQENEPLKKKSKKREDDSHKDVINGGSVPDDQHVGESSPKPKKDSSPKPKKSDSKSETPSKSRPSAPSSPERYSEPKKDGELPSQDRTTGSPQAAKIPAKNARRSFAEALKSNMSNGSKDIPDHEESNESDLMQQQELPGELVSITSNVRPGADMRRSEITAQEAEDTSERQPAEALTSSPSEQIISGIIENKGDNGVSHPNPFSSQPVESLDRTFNQPTRPKSSQGLEQSKHTTPDQASSGYQFKSPKDHISKTTNTGSSTQGKETLKPTDPPRTPISDKTDLQESIQLTRDTRSPKTPERLPIKDRAASESAKTDCQSVDSRETVQPKGLPTTPDKPEPRQKDRPHDQLEFGQSAVSYFPEQSQPRVGSSSSNVIKRSQTPQHASQGHAETRFAKPPSPIQGDLVFSLDKDELDISPKSGKPMGFENIQNSNSEFLHVIGQQGQEKVTSPLPVENETVRGEDQLFDENKSVTDFSEHEEEPELLPHIPLEEQGQLVLFDSPFQPIFDDQGLTSLIGAFKKWETLIKEINEQTEGGHCQPFLLEFSGTLEDENYELLQNQSTIEADDIREDKRGKQPQQTFEASQPIPQASHSSESLVHLVDHAAVADKSSQSRSNSPPRSAHIADDQVPHFSRNGPIQSLCSNVLTGLVGSTTKSADMDSRNIPPVCADTPKRKLRSSSTESSRHKRQRGRQRHKSCQSPERDINPRGKLFQSSDNDIDIRSSWFKHSRRGLD